MIMEKMKISSILLCLTLCAACSSDSDEPVVQQPTTMSYPLTIEVTENPLISEGEEGEANRAAITTTSTLNSFKLDYVYDTSSTGAISPDPSKDTEGKWTTTGSWPSTEETVNWYAYSDGTFNLNVGGDPYINFSVEELASKQKDLLVATASGTYSETEGKLTFTFDHACSALRFHVKKSTNLSSTLTVSSIVLKNVIKQGKYNYSGSGSWTFSTEPEDYANYTLFSGSKTLSSTTDYELLNGSEEDAYLFMIPQILTGGTGAGQTYIEVAWTCSDVGSGSGTAKIPLGMTLVKGTKYDVKINLGKNTLQTMSM